MTIELDVVASLASRIDRIEISKLVGSNSDGVCQFHVVDFHFVSTILMSMCPSLPFSRHCPTRARSINVCAGHSLVWLKCLMSCLRERLNSCRCIFGFRPMRTIVCVRTVFLGLNHSLIVSIIACCLRRGMDESKSSLLGLA